MKNVPSEHMGEEEDGGEEERRGEDDIVLQHKEIKRQRDKETKLDVTHHVHLLFM